MNNFQTIITSVVIKIRCDDTQNIVFIQTDCVSFYQCRRYNRFRELILCSAVLVTFTSMTVFAVAALLPHFLVYSTFKSTKREKQSQIMCSTHSVSAFKYHKSKLGKQLRFFCISNPQFSCRE